MYNKKLCLVLIALLALCNVDGKKTKKNIRKPEEDTTLQPNVVAYSTFGFNDVGSYNGFVPTSPDYASFLSGAGQEATTRLYAPAFPSAADTTGFGGNFDSQSQFGQSFGVSDNNVGQSGMLESPYATNFFDSQSFGDTDNQYSNSEIEDANEYTREETNIPLYGTKINSRYKPKPQHHFNNTDFNIFSNSFVNITNDKYLGFQNSAHENKPIFSESNLNYRQTNNYVPSYAVTGPEELEKPISTNTHSALKFPKVVDFTKFTQYYPTELDTSKLTNDIKKPSSHSSDTNQPNENSYINPLSYNSNTYPDFTKTHTNSIDIKNNVDSYEKNMFQKNTFHEDSSHDHMITNDKRPKAKKKTKKPWNVENENNDFKNWKDSSANQGYGFSTNVSHMNFKYGVSDMKKPPHLAINDEIIPASSNLVDLPTYQYPETEYSKFKKMPEFNEEEEFPSQFKSKLKSNDYLDHFRNVYSTTPATASYWGNAFKSSDYSVFRDHSNKYQQDDINGEEVVNIPKRPSKPPYFKPAGNKHNDWPSSHKNKPPRDWTKDFLETRYKSEEDLLGLRNHDTSHPTYLPTFKSNNHVESEKEYNKLVEKWRQAYVQSKLKDYESYASETKPLHVPVPIPKPYPIEVPQPFIVPVPHPFPVRVPISRPVAVPVVHELALPIEKPVPYPVYKKVPYPVVKPAPVPVEKEVVVPVEKPYPVHIPYVRPVFHHTRPTHEEYEAEQTTNDEDYLPRPDYRKPSSRRRPYPSRHRPRRPSRMTYQERNRRRWPENRRPTQNTRPAGFRPPSYTYRYRDSEPQSEDDRSQRDYVYCKRTGNC